MDGSKSPGRDGITPRFFQVFWPQIGCLVTTAILRFLNTGVMLKEWNNTHIVLLPKVDQPEMVSQFRPISLCNIVYRLASKCIANRIKLVISSLISDTQQAFVPGRLMSDSSIIAHEIMHYVNKTKKGSNCDAVLKLDMHKAFDRVSWRFLMEIMLDGFSYCLAQSHQGIQPCKLLVITAILFTSLNHLMAAIPFPIGICRKIDALIAVPKDSGGLGIKNTLLLSQAMLVKNYWRLQTHPTDLLAKYLIPKSGRDVPIPTAKSRVSQPSFPWSGICKAVDAVSSGICWKLGNGRKINLFDSRWVQGSIPVRREGNATESPPSLTDLLLPSGGWNTVAIFRNFDSSSAKLIIEMEPPLTDIDDYLYWKYTEDGSYSIKTGYLYLWHRSFASSSSLMPKFPWSSIWKIPGSTKFSLLFWRLAHNIMATTTKLNERGVPLDLVCLFCGSSEESTYHLFRSCTITQHVWQSSALGINTQANAEIPFSRWLADLISFFHHRSSETWCTLTGYTSLVPYLAPAVVPINITSDTICIYVLVGHLSSNKCYHASISDSLTGESDRVYIRASSTLVALTRALLSAMRRAGLAGYTSVSFVISCRKLSSVLAKLQPVPIGVRNSVHEIRHLFRIYPFWSVRLATG
ncbi:uncharacterized protein LOC141601831 [Silene latifolia]|uniref:uncharacterized protein LOC141601831 n=1 Tax=Silene latifolia TaxID=37657 RepID=UPI003D780436